MCRCPSVFSESVASASHDILLADRHFSDTLLGIRSVAWDQKNRIEDDVPTSIDLGKECSVHVTKESRNDVNRKRSKSGKAAGECTQAQRLVTPSFTMYNVSRKYHLAWKIEFECVGEKVEVKGQSPEEILVLGPAASISDGLVSEDDAWIMAPADGNSSDEDENGVEKGSSRGEILPAYSELAATESSSASQVAAVSTRKG